MMAENALSINSLSYQFDAEKDIPWDSFLEPGAYFPASMLIKVGFSESVINNPELRYQLEWAWVISSCRLISELEKLVIRFICNKNNQAGRSQRTDLLVKEESKHILVFNRFAKLVENRHIEWSEQFRRCYRVSTFFPETFNVFDEYLHSSNDQNKVEKLNQFFCWLATLYFENYSIYLAQMLEDDASSIQPTWLMVNRVHRQEEEEHVKTDDIFIEAFPISEEEKLIIAKIFYIYQKNHVADFLGVDTTIRFMRAINNDPNLQVVDETDYHKLGFVNDLKNHPIFETTRYWIPFFHDE